MSSGFSSSIDRPTKLMSSASLQLVHSGLREILKGFQSDPIIENVYKLLTETNAGTSIFMLLTAFCVCISVERCYLQESWFVSKLHPERAVVMIMTTY